jgi:hypothetical protein
LFDQTTANEVPVLQPVRFQSLIASASQPDVRFRNNRCPLALSKKNLILHSLKANFMQLQKSLIYTIILLIFLLGVYEIKSGNVRDFAIYKNSTEPIYVVVPGDWLIIGAIGLFVIISHTFSKIKN